MTFTKTIPIATAFAIWAGAAHADPFNDAIVDNLTELGYQFIEIKTGPTQVKVEAIRGAEKLEVIYDRKTGKILKRERESALGDDDFGRNGVQFDTERDNFLNADDDDDDDDRDDDHEDDDDDRRGSSSDSDDGESDHNRGSGSGDSDDDDGDDSDSNSGSGSHDSDDSDDDD